VIPELTMRARRILSQVDRLEESRLDLRRIRIRALASSIAQISELA
jgi:hypothetical protein